MTTLYTEERYPFINRVDEPMDRLRVMTEAGDMFGWNAPSGKRTSASDFLANTTLAVKP